MLPWQTASVAAASLATTAGLLVGGFQYAGRWPASRIFGKALIDAPDPKAACHTVALTYDDGPSPRNTEPLLDLLQQAGVQATFFLIGNHARRHPRLARLVAERGHRIGNHTDMHPDLLRKSASRIRAELEQCQRTLIDLTGVTPALFRPPYGARRPVVFQIARELGLQPVLWNVTSNDWKLGAAALEARVERGMQRNRRRGRTSNLLLHDASHLDAVLPVDRSGTLALTDALLKRTDLRFVPVASFLPAL